MLLKGQCPLLMDNVLANQQTHNKKMMFTNYHNEILHKLSLYIESVILAVVYDRL